MISKENRKSKADALNCGINFAHYRYLCCVDGDTIYSPEALQSIRFAFARLLVAISLGVIFLSVMYFLLPGITLWRSNSLYAMGLAMGLLLLARMLLGSLLGGEAFKRRLVVLGGQDWDNALRLSRSEQGLMARLRDQVGNALSPAALGWRLAIRSA